MSLVCTKEEENLQQSLLRRSSSFEFTIAKVNSSYNRWPGELTGNRTYCYTEFAVFSIVVITVICVLCLFR